MHSIMQRHVASLQLRELAPLVLGWLCNQHTATTSLQVRAALRAAVLEAARAGANGRPGRSGAPALLRRCLAAHGRALLELGRERAAAADLAAQLEQARPPVQAQIFAEVRLGITHLQTEVRPLQVAAASHGQGPVKDIRNGVESR